MENSHFEEPFTRIANRLIRSQKLSVYDKAVFMAIASCNPSFPSYEKLMEWTGLSRERIWKSLHSLEKNEVIYRYKSGRKIKYLTMWSKTTSSPDELFDAVPVRYTNSTSSPDELLPVRQTNPIKNNKKESLKKENPEDFDFEFKEEIPTKTESLEKLLKRIREKSLLG